ncbi:hypothetical protein KFU94_10965 [Chloroflexi bacterium TSY]|nr:hypothetical protein [Chloroflexi bacterium TSY]
MVEFSKRTGEPIGYTVPRAIDNAGPELTDYGQDIAVDTNRVLVHHTPSAPILQLIPCSSIDPTNNDFSQPLLFGGGIEMHNVAVVDINVDHTFAGTGDLQVFNNGDLVTIPSSLKVHRS